METSSKEQSSSIIEYLDPELFKDYDLTNFMTEAIAAFVTIICGEANHDIDMIRRGTCILYGLRLMGVIDDSYGTVPFNLAMSMMPDKIKAQLNTLTNDDVEAIIKREFKRHGAIVLSMWDEDRLKGTIVDWSKELVPRS